MAPSGPSCQDVVFYLWCLEEPHLLGLLEVVGWLLVPTVKHCVLLLELCYCWQLVDAGEWWLSTGPSGAPG